MFELPKRLSLSAQTAAAIRQGIEQKVWDEFLPGERRLSELFQVSRPTIRVALHILEKEGVLQVCQGKRSRVAIRGLQRPADLPRRVVALLTSEPLSELSPVVYQAISEIRGRLQERNIAVEVFVGNAHGARFQERRISPFLREHKIFCSILLSVDKSVQQWFQENSLPALVFGSCHPAVRLPSLDIDHRAVCRHAFGTLLGRGHRRIALIVPSLALAGYLEGIRGFLDGVREAERSGIRAQVVQHDGSPTGLTAKLDALFGASEPPTALIVIKPQFVFAVIVYLLNRGLKVPADVSLIARDGDPFFGTVDPVIALYPFDVEGTVRRVLRLMSRLVDQGFLPQSRNLLFPKFAPGGTIRDLAADS